MAGNLSLNSIGANLRFNGKNYGESGPEPVFSAKSKAVFPKTEVLGKPPGTKLYLMMKEAVPKLQFWNSNL
jgi:hypothetical protein